MNGLGDVILDSIVRQLKDRFRCHTILLYGSRVRGLISATSDYDVVGVRKRGEMTRIAKKQNGRYWDVFVYPEKDLRKLGDSQLSWKGARLLYAKGAYGRLLLRRIDKLVKAPHRPEPQYMINVTRVWAQKEFERCKVNDIQGYYRRAEFRAALIHDYFVVRKKRFSGPKASFAWLEKNDLKTFKLIRRALKNQNNLGFLKSAAARVYRVSLG